jgi:hypothetical protein
MGGKRRNMAEFRRLSVEKFKDKVFDLDEFDYVDMKTKGVIVCPSGHRFNVSPAVHLRGDGGCKDCANKKVGQMFSDSQEEWIKKARLTHGERFGYEKTDYRGQKEKVIITCRTCNTDFEQNPTSHAIGGCGCPTCGIEASRNAKFLTDEDNRNKILECSNIHNNKYTYPNIFRKDDRLFINVDCPDHGVFEQRLDHHLNGHGCYKCAATSSKWSIEFFEYRCIRDGYIQHNKNGGEFRLPEWKAKTVDGYRAEYREIIECHGSYHHGDPRVCNHAETYRGGAVTLGDRYRHTRQTTEKLLSFGYSVVEIWEYDWNRAKLSVIQLQRAFRSRHCL